MPGTVQEFWGEFDPDRMDRTVVGLGRKPALVRAAQIAEPLLAQDTTLAADFGCGTGQLSLHAGTRRIVGVERAPSLAARAAARLDRITMGDLSALPLAADTFDLGFLLFVLDDYGDKRPIVSEVLRTLKPGATLVLAAYSPVDQHMGYLGGPEHLRPAPGTLRVWLEHLPGLCRLLESNGSRVTRKERIGSRYRVDQQEFSQRVARRQGVSPDVARELMRAAGITEWVRRELLLVSAAKDGQP
jgi:SAM-dependent methyltransferase